MLCALRGSRSTLWARGITPPLSTAIHPRVCGDSRATPLCRLWKADSSPRVRGLPCYPSMHVLVFAWLALCALCAWGIVYFGLGLLAELFAPEDPDD